MTTVKSADAVRAIRAQLGITQEAMAQEVGCSYSALVKWENEGRLPVNRTIKKNLQVLAVRAGVVIE